MNIRATAEFRPGNIGAIEQAITSRVLAAVQASAELVESAAVSLVPVRSGSLRDSIGRSTELRGLQVIGFVFANAPHAAFVEYGTGLRGSASPHGALPEQGVPITGSWIYDYRGVGWIGMPAQPFMRPAIDGARPAVLDAFRRQGFRV